jgi:DNA-binding IclR family transcriptional regulator
MPSSAKDRPATIFGKAAAVLQTVIAPEGPLTLKELARHAGIPVSSAHRVLEDLQREGWIVQERESCTIEAGAALLSLSATVIARYGVERAVRPVLRQLVEETGETICLNLVDRSSWMLVTYLVEESLAPLTYHLMAGDRSYLHTGASGRSALAFLPPAEVSDVLRRVGLPRLTAQTISRPAALRRSLAEVRKAGYAHSRGERLPEAVGIAAPVFAGNGTVIGSLLVTIPQFRFNARKQATIARSVVRGAAKLRDVVDPLMHRRPA